MCKEQVDLELRHHCGSCQGTGSYKRNVSVEYSSKKIRCIKDIECRDCNGKGYNTVITNHEGKLNYIKNGKYLSWQRFYELALNIYGSTEYLIYRQDQFGYRFDTIAEIDAREELFNKLTLSEVEEYEANVLNRKYYRG